MSGALEKNIQATRRIAGDGAAAAAGDLATGARIGVWSADRPTASARLTAEALGDILGRFWRNIDAAGGAADGLESVAGSAADACGAGHAVRRR